MDIRTALHTLELSENSTDEEAAKAYKDLLRVWHPDNFASKPDLLERATDKTKQLNEAWELLNDLRTGAVQVPRPRPVRRQGSPWLMAAVIVLVGGLLVALADANDVLDPELRLAKELAQRAYRLNHGLPLVLDTETELTAVFAGPGRGFTYVYRVLNYDKDNVGLSYFDSVRAGLKTNFLTKAAQDPNLKFFFDNNITMRYSFKDKTGADIVTLELTAQAYKAP